MESGLFQDHFGNVFHARWKILFSYGGEHVRWDWTHMRWDWATKQTYQQGECGQDGGLGSGGQSGEVGWGRGGPIWYPISPYLVSHPPIWYPISPIWYPIPYLVSHLPYLVSHPLLVSHPINESPKWNSSLLDISSFLMKQGQVSGAVSHGNGIFYGCNTSPRTYRFHRLTPYHGSFIVSHAER